MKVVPLETMNKCIFYKGECVFLVLQMCETTVEKHQRHFQMRATHRLPKRGSYHASHTACVNF